MSFFFLAEFCAVSPFTIEIYSFLNICEHSFMNNVQLWTFFCIYQLDTLIHMNKLTTFPVGVVIYDALSELNILV